MLFDHVKEDYPKVFSDPTIKIFNIQNVWDFMVKVSDKKYYTPTDVYSFFPPYTKTWFEFKVTEDLTIPEHLQNRYGKFTGINSSGMRIGLLVFGGPWNETLIPLGVEKENSRPVIEVDMYVRGLTSDKSHKSMYIGKKLYIVDSYGKFLYHIFINGKNNETNKLDSKIILDKTKDDNENSIGYGFAPSLEFENILKQVYSDEYHVSIWSVLLPEAAFPTLALTLNFLHCKNVVVERENYGPQIIRKDNSGRIKPFRKYYHVLSIEPMKKVLESHGAKETGIRRAFHMCRGHFRTYEETRKLFGKVAGTFWIPNHVRGSKEVGEVDKDYDFDTKSVDMKKIKTRIK